MKTSPFQHPSVTAARGEVLRWLRGIGGKARSLRDEDSSHNQTGELVARFLSHAESSGFRLALLATGSVADPRFAGNWRWHERVLKVKGITAAPEREDARILACAALLRDELFRPCLTLSQQFCEAA